MKMSKVWWTEIIYFFIFSIRMDGQPVAHLPVGNFYINSGAYSQHFTDAFSFTGNSASLGAVENTMAGIVAERKWMLKELDTYTLAAVFRLGKDAAGLLVQQNGDMDYREQKTELAYGKNLGRYDLGIRFGFLQENLNGYPGKSFGYAGVGLLMQVTDHLMAGWEMNLPVFGKTGGIVKETGPRFFQVGFGYEWGPDLLLSIQILKTSGVSANILSSILYRYATQFFFSFGINSNQGSPVFMSGWEKNQLTIQMYAAYEPVLGFSPGLVILWKNKNKKK